MIRKDNIPKSIDFLKPVSRPNNIWANAYIWMFEVGKYMLIVVELIALGVFISRFVLDEKNNDLTKSINDQVTMLSGGNWKQDSITYENLQVLLIDVSKIDRGQKVNSVVINEIRNGIPYGLLVETLSFNNGRVSLNLKTTDFKSFKDYESAMKSNPNYEQVSFSTTKDGSVFDIRVNFTVSGFDG
ncbi:TPA: hypothetical protein DEP90_00950 [Patescibacteria group bacterium]|nr:hypothetical protein [Patescibacteria group bacterium]